MMAIAADAMYDFYLLKVTSDGVEELTANETDGYGKLFSECHRVLQGLFYLRDNIHDMTFTLDTKHCKDIITLNTIL